MLIHLVQVLGAVLHSTQLVEQVLHFLSTSSPYYPKEQFPQSDVDYLKYV